MGNINERTHNQLRSNEDTMLTIYAHFDESIPNSVDHYLNTHPGGDQDITLKNAAVNLDHTIRFILTPALVGEIFIADTAPTGGETGKYLHSTVYMSASGFTERVFQTISIGTESDYEKYGTQSKYCAVGINPSQNQRTIECNYDSITPDENLVVTINTQYTGLPTTFNMHFGQTYPTGINFRYTNKLNVDVTATINKNLYELKVVASHNNPLGDDNMDHASTEITWSGPSTPSTITHNEQTFTWVWDYDRDNAKMGEYSVTVAVKDLQGDSASNTASFTLEKRDQNNGENKKDKEAESKNLIYYVIIFIVIIIIIIIIWVRKRKGS